MTYKQYLDLEERKLYLMVIKVISCLSIFALLVLWITPCFAQEWTDEQIVNAIYKAEGGSKTKYPYGIKSVPCDTEEECRRICFNTVRNHRKRHTKHGCYLSFLECLGKRYCPPSIHPLNKNWLNNVRWFLERDK